MLLKVSHESPLCLLEKSRNYNDFDYALVHLFEKYPQYFNFFNLSRKLYNREVLLDNSIFELGTAFDSQKFYEAALALQPTMFIVPDVLEDKQLTVHSFLNFLDQANELKQNFQCKSIGAIQGKTWQDIIDCYKFMSDNADMIAISFDFTFYNYVGEGRDPLQKFCSGRQRLIEQLISSGVWNWSKPHHLLGCSLAKEFRYYVDKNIHNIVSCDTSNPVVAAMHGLRYDADYGLDLKPKVKLVDLIEHEVTVQQLELAEYNVAMFKKIIRR